MSQSTNSEEAWPGSNELRALGSVVQAASNLEHSLQSTFCDLIGSKYAAVIVGAEQASSLIEKCKALTKARHDISEGSRSEICGILIECDAANKARNRLIHDVWAVGSGASTHQFRRDRVGYGMTARPVTIEAIEEVARTLTNSAVRLKSAILNALGPERCNLEAQLRWEDHVSSLNEAEQISLLWPRLAGMLGELSRLLARYGQRSLADWAERTRDQVSASPAEALASINAAFSDEQGIKSVGLQGDPQAPIPPWLEGRDPNAHLADLLQQINDLSTFLRSVAETGRDENGTNA